MESIQGSQIRARNPDTLPVHSLLAWVLADQHVESNTALTIWWPCLVFENKKHLYQYLNCDSELKSAIYLELHAHDPRGRGKVAFLLGKRRPRNVQTVLIPSDKETMLLKDFFDNVDEMDEVHGDDAFWREAYDDARNRLLSSQQDLFINRCESVSSGSSQAISMGAPVINQAPVSNNETSCDMDLKATEENNTKSSLLSFPNQSNLSMDVVSELHHDAQVEKIAAVTVSATQPNQRPTKAAKSIKKMRPLTPSPKAPALLDVLNESKPSREPKTKRNIPKLAPWSMVWQILLEDYGYSERKATGFVKLYYLTPQFLNQPLDVIRKSGHIERDYFASEEALQRHVKVTFDWKGIDHTPDKNQYSSKKVGRKRKEESEMGPSSTKKSTPREHDNVEEIHEINILSNEEAWDLLSTTKYGFKKIKTFFCLPNVDPKSNSFLFGYHYFQDLPTLRRSLCVYGIPDPNKYILDDHDLRTWLRLAVVTQVQGLSSVPPYEPLNTFTQAFQVLQKIGFKWLNSTGYTFPRKELGFEKDYDFYRHLSRFGLPSSAAIENIDPGTLLALEMHMADFPEDKRESW